MKHRKIFITILLCLIIALTATMLVACDDDNRTENETVHEYFIDIDETQFEETLEHLIAYGMEVMGNADHVACITGIWGNSTCYDDDNFYDLGGLGWLSMDDFRLIDSNEDNHTLSTGISILYFDTLEHTNEYYNKIQESGVREIMSCNYLTNITKDNKMLICESQIGLFESIKTKILPEEKKHDELSQFIFDNLIKELKDENNLCRNVRMRCFMHK